MPLLYVLPSCCPILCHGDYIHNSYDMDQVVASITVTLHMSALTILVNGLQTCLYTSVSGYLSSFIYDVTRMRSILGHY
ncbi:hypothetical protein BDF22DRAFT_667912 [Syncephalis plumigaleata]|nr:hypothetical protein BDF22DRAFT_667912 [Syncephalis plumigaleata]